MVAALLHFFFLSSFCWVLTEAWQSYMAVTGRLRNRIIRKRFLCLGWGKGPAPLLRLLHLLPLSSHFPSILPSFLMPFPLSLLYQVFLLSWSPCQWASPKRRATAPLTSKYPI